MNGFAPIEPVRGISDGLPKVDILSPVSAKGLVEEPGASRAAADFGVMFRKALDALARTEENYNELSQKVVTGQPVDVHQVMIAAQEMNIAFQLALTLRNKVIEAYQEIMRMQV